MAERNGPQAHRGAPEALVLEERRDQRYLRRPGDRAVRRNRKRKGIARRAASLALQGALVAAVVLLARQVYLFALTSSVFEVKTIAIRGNHRARTADLLAVCSPVLSENIFRADLPKLREELGRSPWVLDVSFRRSLPSTIEATIEERTPVATVCYEGRSYLVDPTGRRLAEYGPEVSAFEFPVLVGLEGLPRTEAGRRIRVGAAAVGALSGSMSDLARMVSELDLSEPDRIALRLADGSPVVYLDPRDCLRNLDHYAAIQGLIAQNLGRREDGSPTKVASVDLRFRGRIALTPDPAEDSALGK